MARKRPYRLGDLQLRILKRLWEAGEASVADVHRDVGGDALAYTTVATVLRKMEGRGLVSHRTEGRRYIYRAAVAEDEVTQRLAGDVLDRVFEGRLADLVSHLLATRDVSPGELRELERLVAEHRSEQEDERRRR